MVTEDRGSNTERQAGVAEQREGPNRQVGDVVRDTSAAPPTRPLNMCGASGHPWSTFPLHGQGAEPEECGECAAYWRILSIPKPHANDARPEPD